MASMDYCVFENTYPDLQTCVRKLKDNEIVNQYEKPYIHNIYELCQEYIEAYKSYNPITPYCKNCMWFKKWEDGDLTCEVRPVGKDSVSPLDSCINFEKR